MNNRKKISLCFLSLILIFVCGCTYKKDIYNEQTGDQVFGSEYLGMNMDSVNNEHPERELKSNLDVGNWEDYENEYFGVRIKYPKNWNHEFSQQIISGKMKNVLLIYKTTQDGLGSQITIRETGSDKEVFSKNGFESAGYKIISPVSIDGVKTYFSYEGEEFNQSNYWYYIEKDEKFLLFKCRLFGEEDKKVIDGILDQMRWVI